MAKSKKTKVAAKDNNGNQDKKAGTKQAKHLIQPKRSSVSITTVSRDAQTISLWQKGPFSVSGIPNREDRIYDALIVGGGITGITTALLLQQQGKSCVLAEAGTLGFGTTGGTSAHLNTFFDTTYPEIEQDFGKEAAKMVADAGKEAFKLIADLVKSLSINCDFEHKDACLYAEDDEQVKQLEEIGISSLNAGVEVEETAKINVPAQFKKALLFKDQGQFHPLKYLYALADAFIRAGGQIFENTPVRKSTMNEGLHIAESDTGIIKAKNLIYATHIPPGINLLHFRCAPYRSYVLGIRLKDDSYPDGLAYDMQEPYHYFRTHVIDGNKYLIIGGEDHKTGHEDPEAAFENLEKYIRGMYQVASVDFKWSAQYYVPVDGLPYIGQLPGGDDHTYVATGYNGNGMIFGTLAGRMISDEILGRKNAYAELFKPSRIKPVAGFTEFVKENADVVYHFVADRLSSQELDSLKKITPGTGKIVDYKDRQLAVYKSPSGEIHALNPVCTHAKCIVSFNPAETSWDCPCHGGRFDINGRVLTGPPRTDLQKIRIE